jgi:dipeptidase
MHDRCTGGRVDRFAGKEYGQFGSANPGKPHDIGSYDNAFIVADPNEAWILETAGRRWVARCLRQGCASISNEVSIRTEWDLGSPDLIAHARQKGWWQETEQGNSTLAFDFAQAYIDENVSRQVSHIRVMRSRQLLAERSGQITPQWMMRIARDHYEETFLQGPYFDAANPIFFPCACTFLRQILPGVIQPVHAWRFCQRSPANCLSSGGRPAHPATAVMFRSLPMAAGCRKWFPKQVG